MPLNDAHSLVIVDGLVQGTPCDEKLLYNPDSLSLIKAHHQIMPRSFADGTRRHQPVKVVSPIRHATLMRVAPQEISAINIYVAVEKTRQKWQIVLTRAANTSAGG